MRRLPALAWVSLGMAVSGLPPCAVRPVMGQQGGATMPIDVAASPGSQLPGGQVKLSGTTGLVGAGSKATLRIKPPGAAPAIILTASVSSGGDYGVVFSTTTAPGTYQVQVTAPDGKGQSSTSFRVVGAAVVPSEFARSADSLLLAVTQAVQAVKQGIQALPGSPARVEAEQRSVILEQRVAQLPAQTAVLKQQLLQVFKAREAVAADNPQWDAYVIELEGWRDGAAARSHELRAKIKAASAETQQCGRMDQLNEMLTTAAEVLSYVTAPFDLSRSFWTDKIPPAFVARAGAGYKPETRFLAIETMKLGAAALKGPQGLVAAIPGVALDLGAFLVQNEFTKYCQKFEGPIAATFLGEAFTKAGEPFLDYTVTLDGKLVLMYDKSAPANKPIGVLGYLEGNGQFDVRDNPKPVIRLTPGVVLFHKVISPPGSRYFNEVGQGSRAFLPHSFHVPVKGTLAGDSIVLALQPAAHDFNDVIEGRSIYVVMPTGGMVPEIIDSKIPIQKAFNILDRVIRRRPVLRVSYAGGTRAEGTFARDTTNGDKTARVRTQLTIKVCNPGCLPLPFTPGKPKQ
ncbi:MAG TPA: hypothetical protein VFZ73_16050 [Gemmatimonadaceae bacterium]